MLFSLVRFLRFVFWSWRPSDCTIVSILSISSIFSYHKLNDIWPVTRILYLSQRIGLMYPTLDKATGLLVIFAKVVAISKYSYDFYRSTTPREIISSILYRMTGPDTAVILKKSMYIYSASLMLHKYYLYTTKRTSQRYWGIASTQHDSYGI
ncbi:hypothetical protein ASPFODRAFT_631342 [Aspergillus luchuensis CBS 106.47]|uniref:Uncharacterized protein n=1 Tax=Aspergillus luchuensis (strain CBS 106.47) TaxID=1137211 RepID=A0A1M3TGL2_ASPLC|nr:hypothetical protein ASPFODRAFT_631342 [Aspergillus luchuensis CBS 106.47]